MDSRTRGPHAIWVLVSRFLDNAASILQTAESTRQAGHDSSDWTIAYCQDGGLRMMANSDWPLDSLESHLGASMIFRVSESGGRLTVDGRAGGQAVRLQAERPSRAAKILLRDHRDYEITSVAAPAIRASLSAYQTSLAPLPN